MATTYVTTAYKRDGRFALRNQQGFSEFIAHVRDGSELIVTFEKAHATRSTQANRYYWGVVVHAVAEHTGYTAEETHDALKTMFLPKKLAMLDGNGEVHGELVIGGSTTKLNKVEFGEYVTRIREFALLKLGLDIPSPSSPDDEPSHWPSSVAQETVDDATYHAGEQ
jgi:hypothetical protein